MKRTIEINLEGAQCQNKETQNAIGHLVSWALDSYDKVTIYPDPGGSGEPAHIDLNAYYQDTKTGRTYTIGAIWNGTAYGFHS